MPRYQRSLRHLLDSGLEAGQVLAYFDHVLEALAYAHARGIVHRDIKPENILLDEGCNRLIVADFGIAHFAQDDLLTSLSTKPGTRLANFRYAAPEQRQKGGEVDKRADIYALGLLLNEMFTGQVPQGEGYVKIAQKTLQYGGLDDLMTAMIQQIPDSRPGSIEDVRTRLSGLQLVSKPTGIRRISSANNPVLTLGWNEVPGATAYAIRRDVHQWTELGSRVTFTVPTPLPVGVHQFEVRALGANGTPGGVAEITLSSRMPPDQAHTRMLVRNGTGLTTIRFDKSDRRSLVTDPHATKPAWSPDGARVVYCSFDVSHRLRLVGADGNDISDVIDFGTAEPAHSPRWSPDGRFVYFVWGAKLFRVEPSADTPTPEKIGTALGSQFDISPDGTRMVWIAFDGGIVLSDINLRNDGIVVPPRSGIFVSKPRWSPQGDRILYCGASGVCASNGCPGAEILLVEEADRKIRQLTSNMCQDSSPSWAPDGAFIAFYSECDVGSGLYIMSLKDLSTRRLLDFSQQEIVFSISALMADVEWSPFLSHAGTV